MQRGGPAAGNTAKEASTSSALPATHATHTTPGVAPGFRSAARCGLATFILVTPGMHGAHVWQTWQTRPQCYNDKVGEAAGQQAAHAAYDELDWASHHAHPGHPGRRPGPRGNGAGADTSPTHVAPAS